jgi:hypothetical protein
MKKVTKNATTTTPATPAPSPVKKVAAKPAKLSSSAAKVAKVAAPVAPAVKAAAGATTIVAQLDVGFGNTLYIRGEGPGLSWEAGVPLDCVADDKWSISLQDAARPVVFKLLVNDLTWSSGEDYVAQPGSSVVIVPTF